MKRVVAVMMGLVMLCGCGAVGIGEPETAPPTTTLSAYITIPSALPNPPDARYLRCVAALPEDNIYLYNDNGNMMLFQDGHATSFSDLGHEKYDYPKMACLDLDGDGEKEIAVVAIVGSGTGLCITDLHILKLMTYYDEIYYKDFVLTHKDVSTWFHENLKYERGKKADILELKIDGKTFTANLEPDKVWTGETKSGSHVYFTFKGNGIRLRTIMSANYEEGPTWGDSFGHFIADVTFDGKQFSLTNIDLVPDEWPIPED